MKSARVVLYIIFFSFLQSTCIGQFVSGGDLSPEVEGYPVSTTEKNHVAQQIARQEGLRFWENKGQLLDMEGKPVKSLLFKASDGGVDMYITTGGLSYVFSHRETLKSKKLNSMGQADDSITRQICRTDMELVGAHIQRKNIVKEYKSEDYNNYYLGSVTALDVHSYKRITIKDVYPGIDWVLYTCPDDSTSAGQNGCASIQYDFVVHAGANPSLIKLRYKGTHLPQKENDGSMKIENPLGYILEGMPVTYQPSAISHQPSANIHTAYTLNNDEVGFIVGGYDKSKELVIDPALYWSVYFGGTSVDVGNGIWSDGNNHVFVAGETSSSTSFPVLSLSGAYDITTYPGASVNAFIAEFTYNNVNVGNPTTIKQTWTTYYGGTGSTEIDNPESVSGDANNIWVILNIAPTSSTFPTTNPGNYNWYESYTAVTNNSGLTGSPSSGSRSLSGCLSSPAILEFQKSTGTCLYATYFSGTFGDYGRSCWDDGTNVWFCGTVTSGNFPVLYQSGWYKSTSNNAAFIIEMSASTGGLEWSTLYGSSAGGGFPSAYSICSDGTDVWMTGYSYGGGSLPGINPGGVAFYQGSAAGGDGAPFIAEINIASHTNTWSTLYGGNTNSGEQYCCGGWDRTGYGNSIYSNGTDVWVTGTTGSNDFANPNAGGGILIQKGPNSSAFYQGTVGSGFHAFIAKFQCSNDELIWGTYYGGNGASSTNLDEADKGISIMADKAPNLWITGETQSSNLASTSPADLKSYTYTYTTTGATNASFYQPTFYGSQQAFVLGFDTGGTLQWGTYFGGTCSGESAQGNSIYSDGINVWTTGQTNSSCFPVTSPGTARFYSYWGTYEGSGDAYITDFTSPSNETPLPVDLISFTANYIEQSNSVLAAWTVATQLNNKEFVVQKTLDGTNYEDVASVAGAGTTSVTMSYSAVDIHPSPGVSYYRLEQIDIDGNTTYFPPEAVYIGNLQTATLNIYPNPVGSEATLIYMATEQNPLLINIIDITGRVVASYSENNIFSGENNFILNTSGLSRGVYFLNASEGQKVYHLKFVKE